MIGQPVPSRRRQAFGGLLIAALGVAMVFLPGYRQERLARGEDISIATQMLDALSCIHRAGLIHRDLKPAYITMDGEGHVTLMDFGLVKDRGRATLTGEGKIVGTPSYLSVESVTGKPLDGRSDLFSVVVAHPGEESPSRPERLPQGRAEDSPGDASGRRVRLSPAGGHPVQSRPRPSGSSTSASSGGTCST